VALRVSVSNSQRNPRAAIGAGRSIETEEAPYNPLP
jgi:hypothetical protein